MAPDDRQAGQLLDPAAEFAARRRPPGRFRRAELDVRMRANDAAMANPELRDALVQLADIHQAVGNLIATGTHAVLWSGSAILDSTGAWSRKADRSKSIFVTNLTGSQVTIFAGPRQEQIPNQGPGVFYLPAGGAHLFNAATVTDWSIYGAAGGIVNVQIFGRLLPPSASSISTAAVIGGTP